MTGSSRDVFVNCPFDVAYRPTREAITFTLRSCGYRARSALELDDASQTRIDKIMSIIEQCRWSVHDLSRTELDDRHGLPRFNMPLELGLFLGAKRFGDDAQKKKRCMVLDVEPFRYQKFISDLSGMDIHAHSGDRFAAVKEIRNWLATVARRRALPAGELIAEQLHQFELALPAIAGELKHDPASLLFVDHDRLVHRWLKANVVIYAR